MLLPNEWREAQERNEIIRLLTKNEIVNKEQATKIIEFVNDAIPV